MTAGAKLIVHKFGGTSVGNAEHFANVADIVAAHHEGSSSAGTVVVLSAMSKVTDLLITGARAAAAGNDTAYREVKADLLAKHLQAAEALLNRGTERLEVCGVVEDRLHELERLYRSIAVLGELTARGRDVVASFGEQLSTSILAAALRERGMRASAISATQLIVTDNHFGAATPQTDLTRDRLHEHVTPMVQQGAVPVITGYNGATESGVTTTLGRGGSDLSAAIVGCGLGADEVWIWSDVDGILTADPNIVPQARSLTELSYAEAADLAYFGADVLHPKTIRPVAEHGIPLRILNSFNPTGAGTLIVEKPRPDRELLPAIISSTGFSMVAVGAKDGFWSLQVAARLLQRLSDAGLDVLMFWQSFSEHGLNLMVREQDQAHCLRVLSENLQNGSEDSVHTLGTKEKVATISVVGMPGWKSNDTGIVPQTFAALGQHSTRIIAVAQTATEYSVSFCIPQHQVVDTVRFLHRELGLEGDDA